MNEKNEMNSNATHNYKPVNYYFNSNEAIIYKIF